MIGRDALVDVRDRESLFRLLRDALDWPVDPEDTFTYDETLPEGDGQPNVEVSRLVPFSGDDPFAIILAEFNQDFRRGALRKVLQAIRQKMRTRAAYQGKSLEDLVFVCALPQWEGLRFARFTAQEGRQPRLAVFGWDRDSVDQTRTLREVNLPALHLGRNLLGEPDWTAETRERWRSAWDVETVTRLFFGRYAEVFQNVENRLTIAIPNGEQRRMYTQRLFNRLLFIAFIQKKGWLRFEDRTDYLAALYQAALDHGESFLNDRLYWAFFAGLGAHADLPYVQNQEELIERRGELPFLNGGLFEMEDCLDQHGAVNLDNDAFAAILQGPDALFNRFNFTITESTPLDIEVAVDPEMLGKVFEELVTGRHETGSYYTPKPVVSFMCREALKCFLETSLDDTPREAIEAFVEEHDPARLTKPEAVLEALRKVRVCDPACGSGAYLLGMLHELLDLRGALFATRRIDARTQYERKLEVIERSLYGVDQDPFAVNIARLRLWLSLAVDYDGPEPPPLPNLDFKVEVGDSLTGPAPQTSTGTTADMIRQQLIEEFRGLKRRHFTAHGDEKRALKKEIEHVRSELAAHEHRDGQATGFDWQVEFAEVFLPEEPLFTIGGAFNFGNELTEQPRPGGMDVVVTNPPYLSTKHGFGRRNRDLLKMSFRTAVGQYDAYGLFLERSLQVLTDQGAFAFIIPKPVLTNSNMRPVRELLEDCTMTAIADPGRTFEAAVEPVVLTGYRVTTYNSEVQVLDERNFDRSHSSAVRVRWSDVPTPMGTWSPRPSTSKLGARQALMMLPRIGDLVSITRGVECGKRDAAIATTPGGSQHNALLRGEDVEQFLIKFGNRWIRRGPDRQFKPAELYDAPKLLVRRVANDLISAVDDDGFYVLNTLYVLKTKEGIRLDLRYLCGILNSSSMNAHFHDLYLNDDVLFPYIRAEQLSSLPVALPEDKEQDTVVQLVCEAEGMCRKCDTDGVQQLREALANAVESVYHRFLRELTETGPGEWRSTNKGE